MSEQKVDDVSIKEEDEKSLSYRFCRIVVEKNVLAFCLAFLIQTSFPVITAILYFSSLDVLNVDFSHIPLMLFDDPSYRRAVAWKERNMDPFEPIMSDPSFLTDSEAKQQLTFRQYTADYVELYYYLNDPEENILTTAYLSRIAHFERSLLDIPYYESFCVLERYNKCRPVDSLLAYLPVTSNRSSMSHGNNSNDHLWSTIQHMANGTADGMAVLMNYLGKDSQLHNNPPRATKLRSFFRVAWVSYDRREQMRRTGTFDERLPFSTKTYAADVLSPVLWGYLQNGLPAEPLNTNQSRADSPAQTSTDGIQFSYYNMFLFYDRLKGQCWEDETYAFGSLAFIGVFLWFQTRSLFLAAFGMYFILTNFIGGNLLYRYVFDYRYFGVFNALAIFLVLAVGVDEIFVFEETWSATGERSYPNLSHRLYDCYRKCTLSIFVPTLATAVALLQSALCPLMALSSFGAFAACVVVLNYVSIVSYFPCVLIFYHRNIESRYRKCKGRVFDVNNPRGVRESSRAERISQRVCGWYYALIWKPKAQFMCMLCTVACLGFLIYSSTNIVLDRNPPRLFVDSHPLGASLKRKERDFDIPLHYRYTQHVQLYFVWGIKDYDRSHCHRTEWKDCGGKVVWDEDFDLNPFPAQYDLLKFCQGLRSMSKADQEELMVKTSGNESEPEVTCFMDLMDSYFHKEMQTLLLQEHKRLAGLPSTEVKVEALMLHVPQIYNLSQLLQNSFFHRYFEIANLYWLNDGYKFLFPQRAFSTETFVDHAMLMGHSLNASDVRTARFGNHSFVYGTRLRYVAAIVNTTIPRMGMRYDEGLAVFQKWEKYFERAKSRMSSPNLRSNGFVIAPDSSNDYGEGIWHWLMVQQVLITSAWQGVIIGVGLAMPILILFTDDFLVGTLTTFAIACTSVSIIGIIPLMGWKLGLLESLNLTLVADLAIDHIVHVAEGYQLSKKRTRKEKVEELLHEAGISIVSGALTTIGASIFLLFAKIVFFTQFGLFILFTVAFSVFYALGMFVVLLALIGPEDDRYSVSRWYGRLKKVMQHKAYAYLSREVKDTNLDSQPLIGQLDTKCLSLDIVRANLDTEITPDHKISNCLSIDELQDDCSSGYESGGVNSGGEAIHTSEWPSTSRDYINHQSVQANGKEVSAARIDKSGDECPPQEPCVTRVRVGSGDYTKKEGNNAYLQSRSEIWTTDIPSPSKRTLTNFDALSRSKTVLHDEQNKIS